MIKFGLNTSTGIYFASQELYVAQVKSTGFGLRLVKFNKAQLPLLEPGAEANPPQERTQALAEILRRLIDENKFNTKKIVVGLPGRDILIRHFQMPRLPKKEWQTAIKFEARKYIPFKLEDLIWDFQVLPAKGKDKKMAVSFVAVKLKIAQNYLAILERAQLKPLALEPAPFSLIRLFSLSKQLIPDKPTAIVDVDYAMADINIVKAGVSYLTRDASLPKEPELVFDNLLNEIKMSLEYYEKLFPTEAVSKILLCGTAEIKGWERNVEQELKVATETADLAKAVKLERVLPASNMAVAIGCALRVLSPGLAEVNLLRLREEARPKPAAPTVKEGFSITPALRRAIVQAVSLSCVGLVIVFLLSYRGVIEQMQKLEQVIAQRPKISLPIGSFSYESLKQTKQELEDKISALDLVIEQRVFWTDKLNQIARLIPDGVWLTDLSWDEQFSDAKKMQRKLYLKGTAYHRQPVQEIALVTKFIADLKQSQEFAQDFNEIKLESMTSAELSARPVKDFTINCFLR